MDALEFINERDRMCAASECCHDCFANRNGCIFNYPANNNAKEQIKVVEEWSAEHPRKTRQRAFLKQYPNAQCINGVLVFCPKNIDTCFSCLVDSNNNVDCYTCRHEFWLGEVK